MNEVQWRATYRKNFEGVKLAKVDFLESGAIGKGGHPDSFDGRWQLDRAKPPAFRKELLGNVNEGLWKRNAQEATACKSSPPDLRHSRGYVDVH